MLNPDNNLYSVAPIGHIVVIGRSMALKGGITRENALNLLTWLILSTNATPDEIRAGIVMANKATVRVAASGAIVTPVATAAAAAKVEVPLAEQSVAAFMGEIDPEEQAALDDVKAACDLAAQASARTVTQTAEVPVRTAAPVPTTPARPIATPIVQPVAVPIPAGMFGPAAQSVEGRGAVDVDKIGKAWGVSS
jgi:hypothetical protein